MIAVLADDLPNPFAYLGSNGRVPVEDS